MARMFRQFQRRNPTMIKATDCDIAMFLLFYVFYVSIFYFGEKTQYLTMSQSH